MENGKGTKQIYLTSLIGFFVAPWWVVATGQGGQSADKERTFYEFVSTGLIFTKLENSRARTKLEIVN